MATAPFVISPDLTAIAVMYTQDTLIADKVLPRVPVDAENFTYLKYPLADGFTVPETRVGRRSAPNQVEFSASEVSDRTQDHGLDAPVPNKDINAWRKARDAGLTKAVDPLMRATKQVTQLVMTRREKRAADLVLDTNNYAAANKVTLAGTSQWSDYSNSDPLTAIMTAMDSMVMRPNVGVIGRAVATKLQLHPKICKAVFGNNTDAGVVPISAIANLLGLEELLVGEGWLNTAAKGQAPNMQRIWGKHAVFMAQNKEADTQYGVSFGLTAQFGDRVAGTIEDSDIGLDGGVRARVGERVKELITANDLAYAFFNAVA